MCFAIHSSVAFTLWPIWLTEVAGWEKKPFIMIRGGWVAFGGCSVQCVVGAVVMRALLIWMLILFHKQPSQINSALWSIALHCIALRWLAFHTNPPQPTPPPECPHPGVEKVGLCFRTLGTFRAHNDHHRHHHQHHQQCPQDQIFTWADICSKQVGIQAQTQEHAHCSYNLWWCCRAFWC